MTRYYLSWETMFTMMPKAKNQIECRIPVSRLRGGPSAPITRLEDKQVILELLTAAGFKVDHKTGRGKGYPIQNCGYDREDGCFVLRQRTK